MSAQGRHRRVAGGRARRVGVKLDEQIYAVVAARAEQEGLSVPRWLAESSVRPAGDGPGWSLREKRQWFAELEMTQTRMSRLGGNLNQLAAQANATGALGAGLASTLRDHEQTLQRLNRLLASLEHPQRAAGFADETGPL